MASALGQPVLALLGSVLSCGIMAYNSSLLFLRLRGLQSLHLPPTYVELGIRYDVDMLKPITIYIARFWIMLLSCILFVSLFHNCFRLYMSYLALVCFWEI